MCIQRVLLNYHAASQRTEKNVQSSLQIRLDTAISVGVHGCAGVVMYVALWAYSMFDLEYV